MRTFIKTPNTEIAPASYKPYIPVLVTHTGDLDTAALQDVPYSLAFKIEGNCSDEQIRAVETLIRGDHPFMLLINKQTCLQDDHVIELIILSLFSKNYIHVGTSPVISFLYENPREYQDWGRLFSEVLISKLTAQGWTSIKLWNVYEESFHRQIEQKRESPLFMSQVDVDEKYLEKNYFFNFSYVGDYLFFKRSSLRAAVELENYFAGMCHGIVSRAPGLKEALEAYMSLKKEFLGLEVENAVLQERLRNAEITIDVIRSKYKDDYEQLIKWYHNEYEILPLWYKRFGHIVKVLMGKRSFKSLFYDHVKKYKD